MKFVIAIVIATLFGTVAGLTCQAILNLSPADTLRIFLFSLASALMGLGTYAALRWVLERSRR